MDEKQKKEAESYDLEALKANVKKAEENIDLFGQAILKERQQIENLQRMIVYLELRNGN